MLTEQLSQLKSVSKDIVMCYPILINKKSCVKNPVRHLTSMLILYRTRRHLILASTLQGHFQTRFQNLLSATKDSLYKQGVFYFPLYCVYVSLNCYKILISLQSKKRFVNNYSENFDLKVNLFVKL